MYIELFIPILLSFGVTFFITSYWIKRAKTAGLTGRDMHKPNKPEIAESGGIPVILGFLIGALFYIGMETFFIISIFIIFKGFFQIYKDFIKPKQNFI